MLPETKLDHGLPHKAVASINKVFSQFPEIEKVILYGSRAMGNYRYGSDIDLTILGAGVKHETLYLISHKLDDLYLPYKIDLSIYHRISNSDLNNHINRVGTDFYESVATRDKSE